MKLLTSAAFGAAALATAFMGSAAPAEARTAFGVYVGGPGYYSDYDYGYRYNCDDYWYRRNHPRRCGYYYDYDDYYYPSYYDDGYYDGYYPGFGFTYYGGGHHRFHGGHHFGGHHWGGGHWGGWGGHHHH